MIHIVLNMHLISQICISSLFIKIINCNCAKMFQSNKKKIIVTVKTIYITKHVKFKCMIKHNYHLKYRWFNYFTSTII